MPQISIERGRLLRPGADSSVDIHPLPDGRIAQTIDCEDVRIHLIMTPEEAKPLGKQPTSIPTRAGPPSLGLLLSQARTAAAQGQANVARVLYDRYLSRMRTEMPGVRPASLF